MRKPSVDEFSDLKAPKFKPSIWFKLFPGPLTVKIPNEFMEECAVELNKISGGYFLGEDLYAFAYEKYTGKDIFDIGRFVPILIIIGLIISFIIILIINKNCA